MKKSLTRRERLRKTGDIKSVLKSGKRIEAQGLKLLIGMNGSDVNRMAVIVGRGCGGAVRRNREKRITREAYRGMKTELRSGNDLVFVIGRFGQDYRQRRESLLELVRRAGLLRTRR
jgi:ribonuclease P protein component